MRLTFRAVLVVFVVATLSLPVLAGTRDQNTEPMDLQQQHSSPWVDDRGVMRSGGLCASRYYSPEEILNLEATHLQELMNGKVVIRENDYTAGGAPIKVNFHIITDGSKGNVSTTVLNNTISKLNATFGGGEGGFNTGISFVLNSVDTWNNRSWYAAKPGSRGEIEMKQTISAIASNNTSNVLNIYTNSPGTYMGGTLLGWATFPWELAGNPSMDGVVMNNIALNLGGTTSYNAGDVVTHEVGHWLGLYHTFQGGCTGNTGYDGTTGQGDVVADTAPEASNASGCPTGRDTCAGNGVDPIDNYMDYSSNGCQVRFTSGQNGRLVLKSSLRPGLN